MVNKISMRTIKNSFSAIWPSPHLTTLPPQCVYLIHEPHVTLHQGLNLSKIISSQKNLFPLRFRNNGVEYALGHGIAHPELSDGNDIEVNEVYYIPNIAQNLISIHKLTNDNNSSSSTTNIVSFFTRHPVVEVMSLIVQDKYIFTFQAVLWCLLKKHTTQMIQAHQTMRPYYGTIDQVT